VLTKVAENYAQMVLRTSRIWRVSDSLGVGESGVSRCAFSMDFSTPMSRRRAPLVGAAELAALRPPG
jgi:hypothetical protein